MTASAHNRRASDRSPPTTVATWNAGAWQIAGRRSSRHRYAAADRHLAAFPLDEVAVELDLEPLEEALEILRGFAAGGLFRQPPRGHRATAPHTRLIVTLANRAERLRQARAGHNR